MSDADNLIDALSRLHPRERSRISEEADRLANKRRAEEYAAQEAAKRAALPRLEAPPAGRPVMAAELRAWGETIWEKRRHSQPDRWQREFWYTEARELETTEWQLVEAFIEANRQLVICEPHNACMGFGIGMRLYEVQPPIAPGLPIAEQYEHLCSITSTHLVRCRNSGSPFQSKPHERSFDVGWRLFSPHTHCGVNADLLQRYGFDPPASKTSYDY